MKTAKHKLLNILKKIITFTWSSTWKAKNGNSLKQTSLTPLTSSAAPLWFTSACELSLYRFKKCLCGNDITQLIIQGEPSAIELQRSWFAIYEEFLDGMADRQGKYKVKLLSQVVTLKFNYGLVQLCLACLSKAYVKEVVEKLRGLIRCGDLDPENFKAYMNDITVIRNRTNRWLQQVEEKETELSIIEQKISPGEQVTEKHFDALISTVERYIHFYIDEEKTTVSRFIEHYKAMMAESERMENEINKQKSAR